MTHASQIIGRRGEELAAAFLRTKGFEIIARNWRCRFGEIDLIATRKQEMRFVEVKTRVTTTFGYPEESVTPNKLLHLQRSIECWLRVHPSLKQYQIDVIAIAAYAPGPPRVMWIEGVS